MYIKVISFFFFSPTGSLADHQKIVHDRLLCVLGRSPRRHHPHAVVQVRGLKTSSIPSSILSHLLINLFCAIHLTNVYCTWGMTSSLLTIEILLFFRRLHCQRNAIHINLFVSFVLRSLICLIKESFHTPEGSSTVINNTATLTTSGSVSEPFSQRLKLIVNFMQSESH